MNAIMECDNDVTRKLLFAEVPKLEENKKAVEAEIIKEEKGMVRLTEEQVCFFLSALKKGSVDDIKYRKSLISVFINKIYLFDDKITFIFNSGGNPVTVDNDLLDWVDKQNESFKCSYLEKVGQPTQNRRFREIENAYFFAVLR